MIDTKEKKFKYIYGPVFSWRLGISLGVDPLSREEKICSFDCVYCQLGKTKNLTKERKRFVSGEEIVKEIESLSSLEIDSITFSGAGEPTIAENLEEIIKRIREIRREKIAILTNSSLMDREDVRRDLALFDLVIAKLDAFSEESFQKINRPMKSIKFNQILKGIRDFKDKAKLALQIMFVGENKDEAKELAELIKEISPFQVQINTPLRPCRTRPLSKEVICKIKEYFEGLNTICVYDVEKKKVSPLNEEGILRRRGEL